MALSSLVSLLLLSQLAVGGVVKRATPDPQYATVVSPAANQTVKLDGSTLVDLLYYGVGGDGYTTKNIRIYIADFNATHPDGFNSLSGDQRYGLEAYMTVPPNAFQPGSTQEEQSSHAFNAYNFSALPLPRAHVTSAFAATLSLLETYTAPDDGGLDRENRVAVPINIVPSS